MVLLADQHRKRSCLAGASTCFWTQCTDYLQQVTQNAQFQPVHGRKCRLKSSQVKSIYFNHPSQGNSTNYYVILGLRDKAAPPTSQQINKFPPKQVKNLATPSSIFILFCFSSSTGELCSQPIRRGNDRPVGRRFPEHVKRSFLDPEGIFDEYFQLGSRRKVGPIKNQLASPNTSN